MSLNRVESYLNELSGQIAVRLHIPWAENYIPYLIAAAVLGLFFVLFRKILRSAGARAAGWSRRLRGSLIERARSSAERKATTKGIRKALADKNYLLAADLYRSLNDFSEAARLYLLAGEHASVARAYEDAGDFENAAVFYREIGNNSRAAENFLRVHDYKNAARMYERGGFFQKAAELYEKAGDFARAAELYEVCFVEEGRRTSAGSSRERNASLSGKLFQKAGQPDRAIRIFLKGNLHNEAALIYEAKGDFINAAECFLQAGNLERAAEYFQKGGNVRRSSEISAALSYKKGHIKEAAAYAEKAGDLLQASEMFAEAGEYGKAGELLLRKEYFIEAGETFLKTGDCLRAAEAYEKGGNYILAADAYRRMEDRNWTLKAADLYEKGGSCFEAGEIFMELNLTERALTAFQKIDVDSALYARASVAIGKIFLEKGMIKLALEKFSRAIGDEAVSKLNIEAYYCTALCYETSGEREKARDIYEKILAEDYHYKDVSQRVQHL